MDCKEDLTFILRIPRRCRDGHVQKTDIKSTTIWFERRRVAAAVSTLLQILYGVRAPPAREPVLAVAIGRLTRVLAHGLQRAVVYVATERAARDVALAPRTHEDITLVQGAVRA